MICGDLSCVLTYKTVLKTIIKLLLLSTLFICYYFLSKAEEDWKIMCIITNFFLSFFGDSLDLFLDVTAVLEFGMHVTG